MRKEIIKGLINKPKTKKVLKKVVVIKATKIEEVKVKGQLKKAETIKMPSKYGIWVDEKAYNSLLNQDKDYFRTTDWNFSLLSVIDYEKYIKKTIKSFNTLSDINSIFEYTLNGLYRKIERLNIKLNSPYQILKMIRNLIIDQLRKIENLYTSSEEIIEEITAELKESKNDNDEVIEVVLNNSTNKAVEKLTISGVIKDVKQLKSEIDVLAAKTDNKSVFDMKIKVKELNESIEIENNIKRIKDRQKQYNKEYKRAVEMYTRAISPEYKNKYAKKEVEKLYNSMVERGGNILVTV